MSKRKEYIWIGLFVAFLGIPFLLNFGFRSSPDIVGENRTVAEKPSLRNEYGAITLESIESFPALYESYYNDTMPLRKPLISASNTLDYQLFHTSSNSEVILGKDGWLFYSSSQLNEDPLHQSLGYEPFSDEQLQAAADNMDNVKEKFDLLGIDFQVLVAPNKESIYTQEIPDYYSKASDISNAQQLVEYVQANTDVSITYPLQEMREYVSNHPGIYLYHKLDTHWNQAGAYVGTYELTKKIGIRMPTIDELKLEPVISDTGDLANMIGIKFPDGDVDYTFAQYTKTFTSEESSEDANILTYQLNGEDPRRVFVRRDSFGKALAPILASSFQDTMVVHKNVFDQQQFLEFDPDIFVLETVERYAYDSMAEFNFSLIRSNVETIGDTTYVHFEVIDPSIEDDLYVVLYWKTDWNEEFFPIGELGHQHGEYTLDYESISRGTVKVCIYTDEECQHLIDETDIDY